MDKVITELSAHLEEGERILWSGSPKNVKLLDEGTRGSNILRWCICVVVIALAMSYVLFITAPGASADNLMYVIAVGAVVVAFLPFLNTRVMNRKVFYFVTNRRVITCRQAVPLKIQSVRTEDISEINRETMSSGMTCVYFGNVTSSVKRNARLNLAGEMPKEENGEPRFPIVFWSSDDPDGAIDAVRSAEEREHLA